MSFCGADSVVPLYGVTVICELPHGHDGAHHGHIDAGPQTGSFHMAGPWSYDWKNGSLDGPSTEREETT